MLTLETLKARFNYDPETGIFTRIMRSDVRPCWNSRYADKPAGTISATTGYVNLNIDKRLYRAHRLAWLYVYGTWPDGELDHKNLDRLDNRISNLRQATSGQNRANTRKQSNNTSGYKGVTRFRYGNVYKWRARINKNRTEIVLGYYDRLEEAHNAYSNAAQKFYGEFARV